MIDILSMHLAWSGKSSLTEIPKTFVGIGFQIPRYWLGAAGFMS